MELDKNCSDCPSEHDCKSLYDSIGHSTGPSVVKSVIIVFLLPILFFIGSLVVCDKYITGIESAKAKTALSALISILVSILYVFLARFLVRRKLLRQKKQCQNQEI